MFKDILQNKIAIVFPKNSFNITGKRATPGSPSKLLFANQEDSIIKYKDTNDIITWGLMIALDFL